MNNIALVSAVIGDYDKIKSIPTVEGVDNFLFTDVTDIDTNLNWNVINVERNNAHPRLQAKQYKLLTHKYISYHYETIIWTDGSVNWKSSESIAEMIENSMQYELSMFEHPIRDCIYEEAKFSLSMPKYKNTGIERQADAYRQIQHPEHWGLWASGIFVRKNTFYINNMFEFWMYQNIKFTYQDQISLPYVLRKFNIIPNTFNKYLWANDWFDLEEHRSNL